MNVDTPVKGRTNAESANLQQLKATISSDIIAFIRRVNLNQHMKTHHKHALKLRAANSKKNAERIVLKKSGMKD
ncbi:hypothetical protein Ddc_16495 [Ditylenchus destructor]|nr:hypothetical protein Ddc_16495 [Ditylenchus destructor]